MKKSIKVLIIAVCAAMCAAFTACENEPAASSVPEADTSTVSSSESELPTVSDIIMSDESSISDIELPSVSENPESEPQSDAESVYSEVLTKYKQITDSIINGTYDISAAIEAFPSLNSDMDYKWTNMLAELKSGLRTSDTKLGYALYDMNNDGVKELFLIDSDYNIFAVFTANDGDVSLLDAYWSRYYAMLLDDGKLYTHGSGGASTFGNTVYALDGGKLVETFSFGCDDGEFYLVGDGERSTLTEAEYQSQEAVYPSYENHSRVNHDNGLDFVEN